MTAGAALVYMLAVLHVPARKVSHKIDYLGGGLLALASVAIILFATFGGTEYAWGSAQIIGLGVIAVAAAAGFYVAETKAAEPVLPLHVFRNRNFSVTMVLTFFTGLAMFGAMTLLPLYQQTVQGASAVVSGLMLTPMMVGVAVTSIVAGQVTTRTGRYKVFPILGGAIMARHLEAGRKRRPLGRGKPGSCGKPACRSVPARVRVVQHNSRAGANRPQ